MATGDSNLHEELRTLLAEGRKVEAVKRYREATGTGLAEAKEAVEALERGYSPIAPKGVDLTLEAEIVALLEGDKRIEAIKLHRARTGSGLKEAKEAVEAIAADHHIVVPSGSGCLGAMILLLFLVMAAVVSGR